MTSGNIICPLCKDPVNKLVYRFHIDSEKGVIERIKKEFPDWTVNDGACSRCIDFFRSEIVMEQRILPAIGPHFPIKSMDDFIVIPTGLRINAHPKYTGKGVTICFIDSGFYPHPDLVMNSNRIKKQLSFNKSKITEETAHSEQNLDQAWHGTMTSVVCAGDGYLSNGLYKGIASEADLVLLKVQDEEGRISTENICAALQWVLKNHEEFDIRIVNLSVSDDVTSSYRNSEVDQLAERLINKNIIVVAAVGNDENGMIKPPANSLNVIAVGGIDDSNALYSSVTMYHSTFGKTVDGLRKPELTANAIWIAAPILPETQEQDEANTLYHLLKEDDSNIKERLAASLFKTRLAENLLNNNDPRIIRNSIVQRARAAKYISPNYMHVDGTSFAAPIVSAVVAQLLQVNPELTPAMIRSLLFSTAKRIEGINPERQGFGVIQPRKALLQVIRRTFLNKPVLSPTVNHENETIEFYMKNDYASQISLAGSFNEWANDVLLMEPGAEGIWKIEIPMLRAGRYEYKFFVDENIWIEDVENPYREPDGFAGFNSILNIEN